MTTDTPIDTRDLGPEDMAARGFKRVSRGERPPKMGRRSSHAHATRSGARA